MTKIKYLQFITRWAINIRSHQFHPRRAVKPLKYQFQGHYIVRAHRIVYRLYLQFQLLHFQFHCHDPWSHQQGRRSAGPQGRRSSLVGPGPKVRGHIYIYIYTTIVSIQPKVIINNKILKMLFLITKEQTNQSTISLNTSKIRFHMTSG